MEYLNHVGLGHIPRLTRVEWGVIRRYNKISVYFKHIQQCIYVVEIWSLLVRRLFELHLLVNTVP